MSVGLGSGRALFRLLAPGLISEGLSANAILRAARGMNIPIQRQWGLGVIREFKGQAVSQSRVIALRDETQLPTSYFAETQLKQPYKYRVFGEATYRNNLTGEVTTDFMSFYDDERLSKSEWANKWGRAMESRQYKPELDIIDINITSAQHFEGWAY